MSCVCRMAVIGWSVMALVGTACNVEEPYHLSSESNAVHRINVNENGQSLSVIIQTSGSVDDLVGFILSLGDVVKFRYENVPAVAAEISPANLTSISEFPGVTTVEKDELVLLDQDTGDKPKMVKVMELLSESIQPVDVSQIDVQNLPNGYANFQLTGASQVWEQTAYGQGSIVAVVDTGTTPNGCIAHAVIGAPGFPEGYNATQDLKSAIDPANHYHGTFVGGVVASSCALDLSFAPDHPLARAVTTHTPWTADFIPVIGQAPGAKLYPVKVFETVIDPDTGDILGTGSETSIILDGLDHLISLKKEGLLDIDIVNLSLGGPTLFDGRDAFDKFIKKLLSVGIFVVSAAGNEGPVPNTVGSPATSYYSMKVGALDYAVNSRVLYEYVGLTYGIEGQGMVMRPTDETRVTNFSSRGPLSDGRAGPDLSALGLWNFHAGPTGGMMWSAGTSFSCPTVAGAAALLNAYLENVNEEDACPWTLYSALAGHADPTAIGEAWSDRNAVGEGVLDVVASFAAVSDDNVKTKWPKWYTGRLKANILTEDDCDDDDDDDELRNTNTFESETVSLTASESTDFVFKIGKDTSKVVVEILEIDAPDNSTYALWPNALEITLESAKRSSRAHPIHALWYAFAYGDSVVYEINDGYWLENGQPFLYQPMEPGLMKLSLTGDYSNESPVSFKVRITRQNQREKLHHPIAKGKIKEGDQFFIPVEIPAGVTLATFDLVWKRDWSRYPTSDVDMLIFDPSYTLVSVDGATHNAPERALIGNPTPGTWYVLINGYEMYKKDKYQLFLSLDMEPEPN